MKSKLCLSAEVNQALRDNLPIVALESTIIAHGMPYPQNLETAIAVENLIRDQGAIPATIAIIKGQVCVGLTKDQLEWIASTPISKLSKRDLPIALSLNHSGATTVSATMFCAHLAGISIFVTGGIGGVHRGVEHTFDISADLHELSLTDVAVIAAGAKSILDIPKTLEVLETYGVPVIGFQTSIFPAFYYRESGCPVDISLDDPIEIAEIIRQKRQLGLKGGILIANPIPNSDALDKNEVETWIQEGLIDAFTQNIKGKEVTPFLLKKLSEKSSGKTLIANIALIKNNAILGAKISKHFAYSKTKETKCLV